MSRPLRQSWAPGKAATLLLGMRDEFATVYMTWEYIGTGWRALAEVEGVRVARQWPGIEMFVWRVAYGGAFVTLRRRG